MNTYNAIKEYYMKKLLYIFICVFALVMMLCVSVSAATTTNKGENGVVWNATVDETNGTATITGATIEIRTDSFDIPHTVTYNNKEYPVTAIGNNAFKEKKLAFGKVTFPETLVSIGEYAFYKTNIYSDIVIPESVTTIGRYAFAECRGILTMKLPSSMKKIPEGLFSNCFSLTSVYTDGVIEEVGASSFYTCYALHNIQIGVGTRVINSNAFYECRGLDGTIDLSTVTTLASNAFQGCFNITGVKLSSIKFDLATFSRCTKIESYEVVPESTHYTTIDGVLYNKSVTVLYRYPIEKKGEVFTLPDTVVEVYSEAFSGAYHVGRINLNKSLTKIGNSAFKGTGVDYMYIPDTVTSIGSSVLAECPYLEWVVISKQLSSASSLVVNSPSVKLVIGRHPSFSTTSVGNSTACKRASEYTCTDHIYGFLDDTASCTESGVNTCIICDRSSYVRPTGHEGAIIETSTLDCTTDYYIIVDCTKCGDPRAKTVYEKAPGHVSTPKTVRPTSTTPGFTVETCSVCNETIISNYVASFYLIGDLNNDGSINNTDANLLASYIGGKTFDVNELTCDINGDGAINVYDLILLRRFIAKIDAEIRTVSDGCGKHLHISSLVASTSSCVDDGIEIFYCLDCGTIVSTKTTDKLGHSWQINSKIDATCANSGFSSVTCTVCGISTVLNEDMLPHTQNWWTMPGKKGYEYSECTVCGSFESRAVDYTEFDTLIGQIPLYYETYYSNASLSLIKPILENYKLALTQEQVNKNVQDFKDVMPRIQYAVTDVPVVFINSTSSSKIDANTNYIGAEIVVAYFDDNGVYGSYYESTGQAKVRGNSTAGKAKKPYNIKFNTNVDLFGLGEDNKYCLLANAIEPALMRNALVRLFNSNEYSGLDYACKYEFVDVYVDGSYRGSYLMSTPVDIEETRVDLDKETDAILEIEQSFSEGDFYIQRDKHSPFFNLRFQIANGNDLSGEGYSRVFATICQLEYAIISGDINEIEKFADIDSLARFYVLAEYFKDVDFNWDSTRFYIEDGKLHGGPAWDYDRAAGHANVSKYRDRYNNMTATSNGLRCDSTTGEYANSIGLGMPNENWINTLNNSDWVGTRDNHTWLTFLDHFSPEFMERVSELVFELKDEMTLMYADVTDELGAVTMNAIDEIYLDDKIYASFVRNNTIWNIPASADEGWSFNSYNEAVDHLRDWLADRHQWMINHYSGKQLAEYCAALADKQLLDPNLNAYAKNTTTALVIDGDNITYTVNVTVKNQSLVGVIEELLYNQTKKIFASNLSYATVVVNLVYDEIASTYSDLDVLEATKELVRQELGKTYNNKYASNTTVSYTEVDGVIKTEVRIDVASTSGAADNQKVINELVKKHFNNANFYVYVEVKYYVNNSLSAHYANGSNYNG